MKTKTLKILTLAFFTLAFLSPTQAQLPNFTKIDTGAITIMPGGHISSACLDMDNDGDLDLFVCNSGVYINRIFGIFKNERNGFYVEMPAFITNLDDKMVSSFGDIDNDGDIDLFAGLPYNILKNYTNNGYGDFQLNASLYSPYSKHNPTLIDLNNDGFLDIVGIYRNGGVVYNDGNGGFLAHESLGLLHDPLNIGLHGISWGDPDDDGDFDVYGGYSSTIQSGGNLSKNACFLNNGDGTLVKFDETSVIVDDSTSENPCVNWVDYDNDGDMDLYVLNFTLDSIDGPLNALYENLGEMQFTKHVFENEMYRNSFKMSSVWGDLDNDADLDLYVTVENNEIPWPIYYTSATPYNILFLNDGKGGFTDILNHPLTLEDSHTALMFDHDNDGDLDVLLTRYSWRNDGHCNLLVNEGNNNSWIVLSCEGTTSNRSAIGTRVQAKCFVNGEHITQTREITPMNGHMSYANLRQHFGLGDAKVIDTLIIRWPSGHVDEYLNVNANQFYRAIEDDVLEIDFAATNYIQYAPSMPEKEIVSENEIITIDLNEHFHFVKGDTLPEIIGDTLTYLVLNNENPDVVAASIEGNILTLESGTENGDSEIQVVAKTDFTQRMESFIVSRVVDVNTATVEQGISLFPNPFTTSTTFEYELKQPFVVLLTIFNHLGEQVELIEKKQSAGKQQLFWNAEELPAGVYFCVLKTEGVTQTMKMIKTK